MPEEVTGTPTDAGAPAAPPDDFQAWREASEAGASKDTETPKAADPTNTAKPVGEPETPKPTQEPEEEDDLDETANGDASKPRRKGGFRRTIDKLNRQNQELADKLAALEARLGTPKRDEPVQKPPEPSKEPTPDDFPDDYDAYVKANAIWVVREEMKAAQEKAAREKAEREVAEADRKVKATWQERQTAARKQYADYDDVVSTAESPMSMTMQNMLLESEDGPDLLYYLARNPAEAERIFELAPITQVRELERISARIKPSNSAPETKTRSVSSAPKPVRPLQGGSTPEGEPADKQTEFFDEWFPAQKARMDRARRA